MENTIKLSNQLKLKKTAFFIGAVVAMFGCGGGKGESEVTDKGNDILPPVSIPSLSPPPSNPSLLNTPSVDTPPAHTLTQANQIVIRSNNSDQFMVNTQEGRQIEYDFELMPDATGGDLSAYIFSNALTSEDGVFYVVTTRQNGNHYFVTVAYIPQVNGPQQYDTTLTVTATHLTTGHSVNTSINVAAQEPFNIQLMQHSNAYNLARRFDTLLIDGVIGANLSTYDKSWLYRSTDITEPDQTSWVSQNNGQYIFPFNVPLMQTYYPIYSLFFNPVAIKAEAENGHVMYFVVQYKPTATQILSELGENNVTEQIFNTTIKYHSLFSDGMAGHQPLNLSATLLIDSQYSSNIPIYPHDGLWSPDTNSSVLKDKLFNHNNSDVIVSKLSNISGQSGRVIHAVHVLLNDEDFQIFELIGQSLASGPNISQLLHNIGENALPRALQEGINRYRQLFQHYKIVEQPRQTEINNTRRQSPPPSIQSAPLTTITPPSIIEEEVQAEMTVSEGQLDDYIAPNSMSNAVQGLKIPGVLLIPNFQTNSQLHSTIENLITVGEVIDLSDDELNSLKSAALNQLTPNINKTDHPIYHLKTIVARAKQAQQYINAEFDMDEVRWLINIDDLSQLLKDGLDDISSLDESHQENGVNPQLKYVLIRYAMAQYPNDRGQQARYLRSLLSILKECKVVELLPLNIPENNENANSVNFLLALLNNGQFASLLRTYDSINNNAIDCFKAVQRTQRMNLLRDEVLARAMERHENINNQNVCEAKGIRDQFIQQNGLGQDDKPDAIRNNPFILALLSSVDQTYKNHIVNQVNNQNDEAYNEDVRSFFNHSVSIVYDADILNANGYSLIAQQNHFDAMRKNIFMRLKVLYHELQRRHSNDTIAKQMLVDYVGANSGRCLDGKMLGMVNLESRLLYGNNEANILSIVSTIGVKLEAIFLADRMQYISDNIRHLARDSNDHESITYTTRKVLKLGYLILNLDTPSANHQYPDIGVDMNGTRMIEFVNGYYDNYQTKLIRLLRENLSKNQGSDFSDNLLAFIMYTLADGQIAQEYLQIKAYISAVTNALLFSSDMDITQMNDQNRIPNNLIAQDGNSITTPQGLQYFTMANDPTYALLKEGGWRAMINDRFARAILVEFGYIR
ncbi:hypothetical protein [Cysteiniphilum litorale]|uniref:hypothetical protein n=1 Tax=Cysteiniphilum litorale TaxID=2056700 RepID=UPI003F882BCD